ncbi:MAG TPA: polyprenol monophosphomannose synthase [Thermomicrobiales bacterium]|nr:polyprenol monophosphomannose synthase [Thermomicrobiales bacterium]
MSSSSEQPRDDATAHASIIVVIPTYNERENLPGIVGEVLDLGDGYSVLVVDDDSPDGTGQLADDLARQHPGRVDVLHRKTKEGLGRAYVAGLTRAIAKGGDLIVQMDADHSHQPSDLARMVAAAADYDLVLGSRYIAGGDTHGWPWHRKLISRAGGIYAGLVLSVPIRDLTGGFKVWKRATLEAIDLQSIHSDGYSFQIETTYRALTRHFTVKQVPITFTDRVAGKSKLSRSVVIEAVIMVWRLRWRQVRHKPW